MHSCAVTPPCGDPPRVVTPRVVTQVPPDNLYIIHRGLCLYRASVLCKGR